MTDLDVSPGGPRRGTRRRLDHIDAMRPVKQGAVVSTHVWIHFAPPLLVGLAMITRFSRDAFLFVSAAMITYSYLDQARVQLSSYWRRRAISVVVPYVVWTVIYFVYVVYGRGFGAPSLPKGHGAISVATRAHEFLVILVVGYHQLYFLLILMQFYVLFPVLLVWLRKNRQWHAQIMVGVVAFQVAISLAQTSELRWFPVSSYLASRLVFFYPIYLIGGMVVAMRLDDVHAWVLARKRQLYAATVASLGAMLVLYVFERDHELVPALHTGAKVFCVMSIPYNVLMIACLYILGVYLVNPARSLRTRAIVQSGSDNAYGVYLSQALWTPLLVSAHRGSFHFVKWPVAAVGAVIMTYGLGVVLSAIVARTPLAKPVVGRSRATWSTLLPRRRLMPAMLHEDTGDGPMDVVVE